MKKQTIILLVVVAIAAAIFLFVRKRKKDKEAKAEYIASGGQLAEDVAKNMGKEGTVFNPAKVQMLDTSKAVLAPSILAKKEANKRNEAVQQASQLSGELINPSTSQPRRNEIMQELQVLDVVINGSSYSGIDNGRSVSAAMSIISSLPR